MKTYKIAWAVCETTTEYPIVTTPQAVAEIMIEEGEAEKEMSWGVTLNTRNKIKHKVLLSLGTLDTSIMHPRDIFRAAVQDNAASIILVHNHPSGDPEPSESDISLTKRIRDCGELMGIPLVDHVIIAPEGKFVSMKGRFLF